MNIVVIVYGVESYIHWRRSSDSVCDFESFTLKFAIYNFIKYCTLPLPLSDMTNNRNVAHISSEILMDIYQCIFLIEKYFFLFFSSKKNVLDTYFFKEKKVHATIFHCEILTGIKYD